MPDAEISPQRRGAQREQHGTFGLIRANGGQVRKREKSTLIVFWKKTDQKNASTRETDSKFILRGYDIFINELAHFHNTGKQKTAVLDKATIHVKSAHLIPAEQIISGYKGIPEIHNAKKKEQEKMSLTRKEQINQN
ncbi:MAG: ArdC-like ssDNA-binding domain-containing protein [Bacteroidota bacterium]